MELILELFTEFTLTLFWELLFPPLAYFFMTPIYLVKSLFGPGTYRENLKANYKSLKAFIKRDRKKRQKKSKS